MGCILLHPREVLLSCSFSGNITRCSSMDEPSNDRERDVIVEWASSNGKAVRQRTVHQETTMFKAGTLPLNMYATSVQPKDKIRLERRPVECPTQTSDAIECPAESSDDGNEKQSDDSSQDKESAKSANDSEFEDQFFFFF